MNVPQASSRLLALAATLLPASVFLSASLGGMTFARADCWAAFSPDRLSTVKVRQMDRKMARDLLVFLHGQGEIVLNDATGKELNDTKEGKPAYKNNGHDQFFDPACNVKWPRPSDKVYLNQTLPPVEKPGKTSLLLREKVREVFLPHWSITMNLPTASKWGHKTQSSRSGREQVLS